MDKFIEKLEEILEWGGTKKDITCLVLSGIGLIISIFDLIPLPFDAAWIAILLCGLPIIMEAIIGLITAFDIKADVLVSLALIASVLIGEDFAAGEVAFIMQLGALLEDLTVSKAREGIEKLVHLTPQTARVLTGIGEKIIPAEQVKIGDRIRVLPGETVPVDGVILTGQTSINQAVMTGESLPVDKTVGDEVASGTVNQFGAFEMEATKVGEDSSIQRMIRLVQSADAGKAKIVGLADRWATWIVVIALTAAAFTWFFTGEIIRAVTILVVFCPCALVLATPTAIMAAIGNATKHGFLVREGDALERLSEHPLGKAIVRCYKQEAVEDEANVEGIAELNSEKKNSENYQTLYQAEQFTMIPGEGVTALVNGKTVKAGNLKLLNGITISSSLASAAGKYINEGSTVIYIAIDDVLAGYVVLADTVRKESASMIKNIHSLGVQPVLLTGDNQNAANAIGKQLGISEIHAGCLPEDKLNYIDEYQKNGNDVCMIGDGINDAPALKKANVGIAMGGVGSDIAVDAADIALVDDEIKELPHLLALSKKMMTTIKLNLTFSMGLNFLAIVLAITGLLGPVVGALVHNAGSILVIVNSALLLRWKK